MADTRKNVLVAGMGHFVSADWEQQGKNGQQNTNRQTVVDVILPCLHPAQRSDVSQEMERAKAEGYDCSLVDVNPEDPEDTLRRIKEVLQERHCDIFMIGFAVRGNPVRQVNHHRLIGAINLTPLLEIHINVRTTCEHQCRGVAQNQIWLLS